MWGFLMSEAGLLRQDLQNLGCRQSLATSLILTELKQEGIQSLIDRDNY